MASARNGTIYIGVTNNLKRRVWEHKEKLVEGFTAQYGIDKLVYYEVCDNPEAAIRREKQLKNLVRRKKINLIEEQNKNWADLYYSL
ncbi:MAG: GIY-YIG nuclease family protein [Patescibacteria group bacterium]